MRKMVLWVLLCCVITPSLTLANDGAMAGIGGAPHFLEGEHPTVRMVREWVRMDVYPRHYTVKATYIFHNDGRAVDVQMGFPEFSDYDSTDMGKNSSFQRFRTWVNGRKVYAKWVYDESAVDFVEPIAYWVKTVHFSAKQTLTVRVEYEGMGGTSVAGDNWAAYHFTGDNWYGTVEQSSIVIYLHLPGTHLVSYDPQLRRRGNRLSGVWQNWEANDAVGVGHASAIEGALLLEGPLETDLPDMIHSVFFANNKKEEGLFVLEQSGHIADDYYAWSPVLLWRKEGVFIRSDVLQKFPAIKDVDLKEEYVADESGYYPKEVTVTGQDPNKMITFQINSPDAILANGTVVHLRKPAFFKGGIVYVPFDAVSDIFGGMKLQVNHATKRAQIEFIQE